MQLPLQVTFRHLERTDAIETNIRELLGPAYLETRIEWTVDT